MLKKIIKIIIDVLTVLVFGILILIIFAKGKMLINNKDYFELFGYSIFNVATGSMEPVIKQNDIIIVKKEKDYNINDIVTFKSENSYITHRIISINKDSIITQGDNNNTEDMAISKQNVVGKVIKNYSNLGIWKQIFTTPKIAIMIFVTLLLFDLAFSYVGKDKKKEKKISQKIEVKENEIINDNKEENKLSEEEIDELINNNEQLQNDYTVRLDLNELQKQINKKINKE